MSVNPVAPTAASVLLGLVGSGTVRFYKVKACLANAPTNCKPLTCATVVCGPITGLASGANYVVSATATLTTGQTIKASSSLQLPMPPAAAPILIEAEPAGRRKGKASALPPRTGPCSNYFWVFAPAGGGRPFNSTSDTLEITTANTALAPGGVYDTRVACLLTSRKAGSRNLLQGELGPFSNTLKFVMPAAGAPFLEAKATGASTAEASIELPTGTGAHWQDGCVWQVFPGSAIAMPSSQDLAACCLTLEGCCACHGHTPIAHCHEIISPFLLVIPGWVRTQLSVCILGGATTACRTVQCSNIASCPISNLLSGTTYSVTSVSFKADNTRSSISNAVSGDGGQSAS